MSDYIEDWRERYRQAEREFEELVREAERQRRRELPILYRLAPWLALVTIVVTLRWAWHFRYGEILETSTAPCSYLAGGQYITTTCYTVVYRSGFLGLSTSSLQVTENAFKYATVGGNIDDLPLER